MGHSRWLTTMNEKKSSSIKIQIETIKNQQETKHSTLEAGEAVKPGEDYQDHFRAQGIRTASLASLIVIQAKAKQ